MARVLERVLEKDEGTTRVLERMPELLPAQAASGREPAPVGLTCSPMARVLERVLEKD